MKKRGMSGILVMVMLVSILLTAIPVTGAVADGTTITLGAGALTNGAAVWFGSYNNSPVQWRVMGAGNDGGNNSKLLLSEYILDNENVLFNESKDAGNSWQGSKAKEWCGNFKNNNLTAIEQGAVVETSKDDAAYQGNHENFGTSKLINEYVFFLSAQEAETTYFPKENDTKRIAYRVDDTSSAAFWWLRSPYATDSRIAGVVDRDGWANLTYVIDSNGARPAFNLNLSSVLFSSLISSSSNQYKLTLKDDNLEITKTNGKNATWKGSTITIPYTISGTNATENTKAYVMVTESAWGEGATVLQYEKLASGTESGTGTFTLASGITGTWGSDYHVYLLAINEGGEKKSDYASAPVLLPTLGYPLWVGGTQVTSANMDNIPAASGYTTYSGKASYDAASNTLTLDNYSYEGKGYAYSDELLDAAICYTDDSKTLTISLSGNNSVIQSGGTQIEKAGISSGGDLKITGSGNLTAEGGNNSYDSLGMETYGKLQIDSTVGIINAIGGEANTSIGIWTADGLDIAGGTIKAEGGLALCSYGILIIGESSLNISGGAVTATAAAGGDYNHAIYAADVQVTGGTLKATAGAATQLSNAIYSDSYDRNKPILTVGTGAQSVELIGGTGAVETGTTVKTALTGFAWLDTTGDADPVKAKAEAQELKNSEGTSYRKAVFQSHHFTYAAGTGINAHTITSTCSDTDCRLPGKQATLSLTAPAHSVYGDGKDAGAVITDLYGIQGDAEVLYYKAKDDGAADGDALSAAPADAGKYRAEITLGSDMGAATAYVVYDVSATPLTVSTGSASKTYDGTPLTCDTASITGLVNGETATVTAAGTQTNAGVSTNTYSISWDTAKEGNYSITENLGTLTVNPTVLTVTAKNKAITYGDAPENDGVEYTGLVNNETKDVLGGALAYDYNYVQYGDVGSSYIITPKGLTSDNYTITFVDGALTVEAKEVGLDWSEGSFTYNGKEQAPAASASGLVNGDEISVTVSGGQTKAGTGYTATADGLTGTKAGNYKLPDGKTQSFSIAAKSIAGAAVTLDNPQLTYNGGEQTVSVTEVTVDGLTLTAEDYDVAGNKGTDQGGYAVKVTGKGNFTDAVEKAWQIDPKDMTVKAENVIVPCDGAAHGISVTVTDPANGAVVKYGKEEGTYDLDTLPTLADPGSMTVYFRVTAANYNDFTGSATVQITKDEADAVIAMIGAIGTVEYTDASKEKIDEARKAYDALNDAQKALVTNADTLAKAEEDYAALKEADEKAKADAAAAKTVSDQIGAIGTVEYTDASKEKIDEARKAYDALSDAQKTLVTNADTLAKAEEDYADLKEAAEKAAEKEQADTEAAKDVTDAIATLPDAEKVDLASKKDIEAARAAYDALTDDQKAKVPAEALKKLEDAEKVLAAAEEAEQKAKEEAEKKEQADTEAAKAVTDLIDALPAAADVKVSDKEAIEAARAAYDALTDDQKAKVPAETLKKLEDAEKALAAAEEESRKPAPEPVHEHTPVTDPAKAPTCVDTGLTEGSHCSGCGAVLAAQTVIPATGEHAWNEGTVTKEAGVFHAGVKVFACTVCGKTREEAYEFVRTVPCAPGWQQTGNGWMYGEADGLAAVGVRAIDGKYYVFDEKGIMATGFKRIDGVLFYAAEDGSITTGWQEIGGNWYYVLGAAKAWDVARQSAVSQTVPGCSVAAGWLLEDNKWYYMDPDTGAMQNGWILWDNRSYYLDENGVMQEGWLEYKDKWYYLQKGGAMLTGWKSWKNKWYYFGKNGAMKTGWQKVEGKWYYLDGTGAMQTGWFEDKAAEKKSGKKKEMWYWLGDDGAMVTGWQMINGKWEEFDDDGLWIGTWDGN